MKDYSYKTDNLISEDIDSYLKENQDKSLLRFITCGSVDDGKSTLIGRLLYDSKIVFEDQLAQLEADSKKMGTQGQNIDFSLLVDGLAAEREQGITIDVAYRFFTTKKRKFIVADTPGHEQYTRNMVTGASTAKLAIILIDARKAVLTQTLRHSFICHLLGIKNFVIAVNKMDLVDYDKKVFNKIVTDYENFALSIGITSFEAVPISGLNGDNIVTSSQNTIWYKGPTLLSYLENIELDKEIRTNQPFTMPVQWVNRPNLDFRGFSGRVSSGTIKPGDEIIILPSKKKTQINSIITHDGELDQAVVGQSITLTLKDDIDCSRGEIITVSDLKQNIADQFESTIIWMSEEKMVPGRSYFMKINTQIVSVTISEPKYKIHINTLKHLATRTLEQNEIGLANITTDLNITFTPYKENRTLGGFILIDKMSNSTVGAGLINFALRRSNNIHWQNTDITREQRANIKHQKPMVVWFTGLSGSGKSTIANLIEKKLTNMQRHTFILDGDNLRHGLNKDLGFTHSDRIENLRRAGEVAKLMSDAGLIVIASFISPFRSEREMVRKMMKKDEFIEVFIDTPLSVTEKRDVKGLYAKARSGELKNFTGIDSPYEKPLSPEIHIQTIKMTADEAA
ncbi:sulfate adenylyltransferase subunit CysN, partial [Alphaproteobacteria bacterium]|nr:sulfate adenylyltransferase subunit CysN [Alphaproteobacteria bacterium]